MAGLAKVNVVFQIGRLSHTHTHFHRVIYLVCSELIIGVYRTLENYKRFDKVCNDKNKKIKTLIELICQYVFGTEIKHNFKMCCKWPAMGLCESV